MTKSLTEKWKNGELDGGYYYLIMEDETLRIDHTEYKFWNKTICWEHLDEHFVKEVLAPVPNYQTWKNVREQWKVAITQIEKLQEQLNEANEVIKTTKKITGNIDLSQLDYEHRRKIDSITTETDSYLEKWGVK